MHIKLLSGLLAGAAATAGIGATAAHSGTSTPAVLTASTGAQTPSGASPSANCDADTHWPAYVQGQPDAFDAGDDGVYLWHNPSGGWSLRVSHPLLPGHANRVVFTGTIVSRGQIGNVVKVKDEKGDVVKVGPKDHSLRFRFVDYGGVDGVNFTTTCTPGLRVNLKADRSTIQTQYIHLGDQKVHPGSNPFRIRRRDADTGTLPVNPKAAKPQTPGAGSGSRIPRGSGSAAPSSAA